MSSKHAPKRFVPVEVYNVSIPLEAISFENKKRMLDYETYVHLKCGKTIRLVLRTVKPKKVWGEKRFRRDVLSEEEVEALLKPLKDLIDEDSNNKNNTSTEGKKKVKKDTSKTKPVKKK